ncbi:MAG: NuoM family protein [Alphaproteobacteria bacterium]
METMIPLYAIEQVGLPILSLALWIPAIAAILLWLGIIPIPSRWLALGAAGLQLIVALIAVFAFRLEHAALQLFEAFGIYRLGLDGVSILFLPLTAILTFLCIYTNELGDRQNIKNQTKDKAEDTISPHNDVIIRRHYAALLAISAILTGAFCAADIRLFWLFFSAEAIPVWFLLRQHGRSKQTIRDFAIMMAMAAGLSLIGLELLIGNIGSAKIEALNTAEISLSSQKAIFVLLALAFAIRAPLFPLHGWLPRILEHGPVMGLGVFLVGLKVAAYGFLRFMIIPMPEISSELGWVLATLGGIGAIYGAAIALIQTDLRRLLAYASIAHVGMIVIGLFSLNLYGIEGGLLQMLTIGMAVAGLYMLCAFIARRVGSPDVAHLGSMVDRAPWLAGVFLLTALAAVGMPGTSGFNGEHLVVIGAYKAHWIFAMMVVTSTLLTAAYLLRFFQHAFMNPAKDNNQENTFDDLRKDERIVAASITAMVLVVGLYTGPFIALMRSSITVIADRLPVTHAAHIAHGDEPSSSLSIKGDQ